ncbi:hypothetical protein IW147_000913 [Coemansia sp. RSA 720]|nr:hypothetical protein IW147_000913 [Coemansia sp. RSA 720]
MAETHKQVGEHRSKHTSSPQIVSTDFDAVSSYLELDPHQHGDDAQPSYSPSTTYTLGLSPAWSLSSSNDTNSSPPMDSMFPSLCADQTLDGWLQQFVSASALEQELGLTLEPNVLNVLGLQPVSIAPQELVAVGENASKGAVGERGEMKRVLAPRQVEAQNRTMVDIKPRLVASTNRPIASAERHIASADRRMLPTEAKPQAIGAKPQAIGAKPQADPKLRPIAQAHSPNARKQDSPTPPDTVAQKRQERLIKNRAAALLSRKRKREYLTKLEVEVEDLREANEMMAQRMAEMERRLSAVTEERDLLRKTDGSAQLAVAGNNAKEPRKRSESKPEPESGPSVPNKRQRTAGALLMAMLFSFSMFTLPSLFMGHSQISVGGVQSAGVVPAPRLLLPPVEAEFPLVERVRRSINAFTQQGPQEPKQGPQEPKQGQLNRTEDDESRVPNSTDAHVRPMTMEESAGLHAWIRRGLKAGLEPSLRTEHTEHTSSLAIVNRDQSPAKQLDYAMLYCPSMKHVQFSDAQQVAEIQHTVQRGPRVLDASDQAVASPKVERTMSHDLLVPTHDTVHLRPKMSLYSPIAQDAESSDILPPWDEYARLDDSDARQKYLRIDVEVVGSKWVTADKFASGLF